MALRRLRGTCALVATSLFLLAAGGCGDDVSVVSPPKLPTIRAVAVSPSNVALRIGQSVVMVAAVDADSGADRSVTWSSADPRRATVSATGIVTAVSEGIAVISATSKARPELSGTAVVGVQPAPTVRSISLVPSTASMRVGQTLPLVANVVADSGADRTVTWASVDPTRLSVSASGVVTALASGTAVITATSTVRPEVQAAMSVTILPAAGVKALTVTPQSLEMTPGLQRPLAVTIDVDEGVSRGVNFLSSATNIASVSSTGVVTAVAPGTATVSVIAQGDARAVATVAVIVRAPAPPTISIQSITQATTANPVNLAAVEGQIDVLVNATPGEDPLARIDLILNRGGRDTVVASQVYQSVSARASAIGGAPSVSAAVTSVLLSFRSDAFDPATGNVAFRNGAASLRAEARATGASGATVPAASNSVPFQLANRDGFYVSLSNISTTGIFAASDEAGLSWLQAGGGLVVRSVPVLYTNHSVTARTIAFPGSTPAKVLTSVKPGISEDTLQLPNFTSPATGAAYAAGQLPAISAVDEVGNPLLLIGAPNTDGAGLINATNVAAPAVRQRGVRIDNAAPPAGAAFVISSTGGNSNNWVNGQYEFSSGVSGIVPDQGVGLTGTNQSPTAASAQLTFRIVGGTLADTTIAATASQLPASDTHLAYTAMARYADRLGNVREIALTGAAPAHPLTTFGVDKVAPAVRYALVPPPAANAVLVTGATSISTANTSGGFPLVFGVEASDDRSGFGSSAVGVSIVRLALPNPVGAFTGTKTCVVGVVQSGSCNPSRFDFTAVLVDGRRQHVTPFDNGTGVEGYYSYAANVRDQAGNVSASVTSQTLFDAGTGISAPQVGGVIAAGFLRGNEAASFLPTATDNVELISGSLYLTYPNLPNTTTLAYEGGTAGSFSLGALFDDQLTTPVTSGPGFTIPKFIRALEITDAQHAPQAYSAGTVKPTGVNVVVRDGPNLTPGTMAANAALLPGFIESPSTTTPGFAALTGARALLKWRPSPAGTATLAFEAVGPSGQTESPFTRVILVRLTPGVAPNAQVWRVLTELTAATGSDNGIERVWTYQFGGQGAGSYIAIGVGPNGDALASQVVLN